MANRQPQIMAHQGEILRLRLRMTGFYRLNSGKSAGPGRWAGQDSMTTNKANSAVARSLRSGRRPPVEMTGNPGERRGLDDDKQTQSLAVVATNKANFAVFRAENEGREEKQSQSTRAKRPRLRIPGNGPPILGRETPNKANARETKMMLTTFMKGVYEKILRILRRRKQSQSKRIS